MVSVWLTVDCNLACRYCKQKEYLKNRANNRLMPWDIWLKTVEFINNLRGPEKLAVDFFGGEPLLYPNTFIKYVGYLLDSGYKGYIRVTTNGTIMNEELYNFIKCNNIKVNLSFDGLDQSKFRGGLDLILKNLDYLVDIATQVNYVVADPSKFLDNVLYMWKLGFNIIDDIILQGRDVFGAYNDDALNEFKEQYELTINIMIESFKEGYSLVIKSPLSAVLSNYQNPVCGWHRNALGIDTDGNIYPCPRGVEIGSKFIVGNVFEGINTKKLANLRKLKSGYCIVRYYQDYSSLENIHPEPHIVKMRKIKMEVSRKYRNDLINIRRCLYEGYKNSNYKVL